MSDCCTSRVEGEGKVEKRRWREGGGVSNVSSGRTLLQQKADAARIVLHSITGRPGYHLYTTWLALYADRTSAGGGGGGSRDNTEAWGGVIGGQKSNYCVLVHEVRSRTRREEQERMNPSELSLKVFLFSSLSIFPNSWFLPIAYVSILSGNSQKQKWLYFSALLLPNCLILTPSKGRNLAGS